MLKFVDITQLKKHTEEIKLYYFSNILCYIQTCSNDHLKKTTTRLRRLMLSLAKQNPIELLLYRTTTCLTRPAPTFLVSQMKKTCIKQLLQNLTQHRKQTLGNIYRQQRRFLKAVEHLLWDIFLRKKFTGKSR